MFITAIEHIRLEVIQLFKEIPYNQNRSQIAEWVDKLKLLKQDVIGILEAMGNIDEKKWSDADFTDSRKAIELISNIDSYIESLKNNYKFKGKFYR